VGQIVERADVASTGRVSAVTRRGHGRLPFVVGADRGGPTGEPHRVTGRGDLILGRGGPDSLFGDTGNDQLRGDSGDDRLFGGSSTDYCAGSQGTDLAAECEVLSGVP
jgi:Ca2+-binding RTX toxin-like protein